MSSNQRFVTTVWQIMDAIQNNNQLEDSLSKCIDILCETLQCQSGLIWMENDDDERLYVVACKDDKDLTGISVTKNHFVFEPSYMEGQSQVFNHTSNDNRFQNVSDIFGDNVLIVPLKTGKEILGCVQFNNKVDGFDEEDIRLCENAASIIAIDVVDKGLTFEPNRNRNVLVSLRNVVKEFKSGDEIRRILNKINLDVYEGELLVVLGESGCGKSTMLNIIGGMDRATSGELIVEGEDFSHPSEHELTEYRRHYIGFIFQAYNLMPNLTALENVKFIAEIANDPLDSQEMLEMVGLGDRGNRYPSAMSGGQQQRVCIARAIVKNPKIVLADEPTAALDVVTGKEVLKVIEKVVKERKTTVIMVTHNVEIAKMANRVVRLKNGNIDSVRVNLHPLPAEELSW